MSCTVPFQMFVESHDSRATCSCITGRVDGSDICIPEDPTIETQSPNQPPAIQGSQRGSAYVHKHGDMNFIVHLLTVLHHGVCRADTLCGLGLLDMVSDPLQC